MYPRSLPIRTVVGCVLLAADQQLGVEELAVGASSDLVDGRGVQVDEDGTRDVFAAASLGEEGLVRARLTKFLRIGVGAAIRQQAVLEEVTEGYGVSLEMANLGVGARVGSRSRTAPRRCYLAGHQLGRCEGGRSVERTVSIGCA